MKYPKAPIYAISVTSKVDTTIYTVTGIALQEEFKKYRAVSYQKYKQKILVSNASILSNKCNKAWLSKTEHSLARESQKVAENSEVVEVMLTIYEPESLCVKVINNQIVEKKWLTLN